MSGYCFEISAVCGKFGVLQRLVASDTGNVLARSQRNVNPTRAKRISQYIQNNSENYVLTGGSMNSQSLLNWSTPTLDC
ncbi:hypothetical protein [Vibrio mediterranei]|uniref:hypothetical protein n=1 Tax=Vibrio mediterranei TaxID=689 RepID=UPI001EFE8310|nr:hypothetical protein [Vibrio mediterranei]MCG9660738.1 hypothetical protein [Vibrio mediterranei]